jgi:hypothetical protein
MSNKITIKRSAVPNKIPQPEDLDFGEFAINYNDGNLFFKNSSNTISTLASTKFVNVTGNVSGGNLVTAGKVDALGNITGSYFIGNGSQLTGVSATAAPAGNSGDVQFNNAGATAGSANFTFDGTNVSVAGTVNSGNFVTGGTISATGNISGNYIIGNGSLLTGIDSAGIQNGTSNVRILSANGNVSVGVNGVSNILIISDSGVVTSNLIANTITGSLVTSSQPNITSIGTLAALSVTGNILTAGLISAAGAVTGASFTGNGRALTSINAANIDTGTLPSDRLSGTYTITVSGAATTAGTVTTAAQPNITSVGTLSALSVTGNITSGNVTGATGAFTTVTGNGRVLTSLNASNLDTGTVPSGRLTGSYSISVTSATTAGTVTTAAQPNITSVGTLSALSVTGNITSGNFVTTGLVNTGSLQTSGNAVIGGNLIVNGNVTYINITDLTVQDPVIGLGRGPNNTPLITNDGKDRGTEMWYYNTAERAAFIGYQNSTGKLIAAANVSVANDVVTVNSFGSFVAGAVEAATVSATGNITGGNVTGTNLTGTLLTATQTNITSVGTLSTLSVSGNITSGNLLTNGLISASGQITGSQFNGSGAGLASIPGANVTGTVASATTAGTVTTAAQPNITSVGTLTSLAVTGNATAGNFVGTLNGSGANVTSINATNISSGTLAQARLANASLTVNGTTIALGGSATITATATNALTIGTGLSGTSYNGSTGVTITNTGVTSIGAGTGISVNATTGAVTVTNTGVTSAAAGTGVSVSAGTGAVTFSIGQAVAASDSPTFAGISLPSITKTGTSGVGNIGAAGSTFNTIFARATSALYADLAERYQADCDYPIGTVLVFGGDQEVTESTVSHDTAVAGVVSENPSYLMNAGLQTENSVSLALLGRVKCRVVGVIRSGELLVSSDIPGVACRLESAKYLPGCVIGKAIESYNSTEPGIIEIAVGIK